MKFGNSIFITFLGICPTFNVASANNSVELNQMHAKIQKIGTEIKQISADKTSLQEQLRNLEKQYGDLVNILTAIKVEIKHQEEILQELRGKLTGLQKDISIQQRVLEGLIKSAYAMGEQEGIKLLFNQRDPSLSGRMLAYHDYLGKSRMQKLSVIQEDYKTLRQLEAQKDKENQILQISLDKKQQETEALQLIKIKREKLLSQLNDDYSTKNQQMESLLHDEKKLEALVASLQKTNDNAGQLPTRVSSVTEISPQNNQEVKIALPSPKKLQKFENENYSDQSFADLQGQLPWPVQGIVSERFGTPRFETTWDGMVISAKEGADIHAVASGRVVYADWLRGYGLMVIVSHGKGYMSLYAFNQSLHKNVGEQVKAGETLASAGRSGGRAQAALYFGIRKNGRPVNPEQWCRKPGKG